MQKENGMPDERGGFEAKLRGLESIIEKAMQKKSNLTLNFFLSPIGQHVERTDKATVWMRKEGEMEIQKIGEKQEKNIKMCKVEGNSPTPLQMCRAAERTQQMGLWWSKRSWAVVMRIYQIKGYKGGYTQFIEEVESWPYEIVMDFECNFDAIQKPLSQGLLDGMPDDWEKRGGMRQAARLGRALLKLLEDTTLTTDKF